MWRLLFILLNGTVTAMILLSWACSKETVLSLTGNIFFKSLAYHQVFAAGCVRVESFARFNS